jgi:CHAT domain-containing protein
LEALSAIEAVRELQQEESGSASVFSAWVGDYQWLAGRLLETADEGSRATIEAAFAVVERMRARVLLDALREARVTAAGADTRSGERRRVLARMVDAHLDLLDPRAAPDARRELARRLEQLEAEERRLRAPAARALDPPSFARLDEVEQALDSREALLSYSIGLDEDLLGDPAGGGWVTVSTRGGTTAHRVAGRVRLRGALPVYVGLFGARDGREKRPSTALYRDVLEPVLRGLPAAVDRLVIVPDDVLHALPFAALREAPEAPPLAERFSVTLAPSATLWLGWRRERRALAPRRALVLADPALPGGGASAASRERGALDDDRSRLGPLPHARREGREVVRRLAGSRLLVGSAAAESSLKQSPLGEYALLHFATHALVDPDRPDRSSLVLAPGADGEDGMLQGREIADLRLDARVVVLAACRSAGGSIVAGEGVMSLARAFFRAGAHGVVGSLWPLRDDDAAAVLDLFYRRVAEGESLAAALQGAQRAAIARGAPAAAWAGVVVAGDAALVPFPGGVPPERVSPWWLSAVAVLAAGAVAAWLALRRAAPPR